MRAPLSVLIFSAALLPCVMAQAPARKALFLINTEYANAPKLTIDAKSLEEFKSALIAAKFVVREERNLTQAALTSQVGQSFLSSLQPKDTVLLYYYGYGLQKNSDNFLVPVDFDPKSQDPISRRARSLTGLLQSLEDKNVGLKLILIDAPLQPTEILSASDGQGLTLPDLADIKEVAYLSSAARNAPPVTLTAQEQSSFLRQMTTLLRKPGTSLVELLTGTEGAVSAETKKLTPFQTTQGTQPFRFTDPPPEQVKQIVVTKEVTREEFTGKDRMNQRDRLPYVYVKPGKFLMGCVPNDTKCEDHEKPQHEVTITQGFWMGETEVTVDAYQRFVDMSNKKHKMPGAPLSNKGWKTGNKPIVNMSKDDATAFCTKAGGRLPTEAEWEYAARGGKENEVVPLNAENARDKANFYGTRGNDRFDAEAPVKQFDASTFGLYDMFGNVWEMVSDFYSPTYYATSPKEDPKGPDSGKESVLRGGSWNSDHRQHLRISFRYKGRGGEIVGFRCVLPDSPETRKFLQ